MTNRVVIGALPGGGTGIRVSRPGNNVLSTTLTGKQLAFDSRWTSAARVLLAGSVTLTGVAYPGAYTTINFGTTFATTPPCFVFRQVSANVWVQEGLGGGLATRAGWPDLGEYDEPIRVYTNRLEIRRPYSGSAVFRYLILRPT